MSFEAPLFLLALGLLPLAVLAYVAARRRRRRYAVRYPALDVLAGVVPRRGSWLRHLPAACFGLALAALIVALARPEATVAVERERASVVLATDTSGSMQATDVAPDRMTAVKAAARGFVEQVPDDVRVGVVAFSTAAQAVQSPTLDRDALLRAVGRLEPNGGTATGDAIDAALRMVRARPDDRTPAAIVLLSDGKETAGVPSLDAATRARRAGVAVYTVALGTPAGTIQVTDKRTGQVRTEAVPPDPVTLQEIARRSGGRFFAAPNAEDLGAVFERLGSSVAKVPERQEVTASFAGGALALLLLGSVLSLLRGGRLP